MTLGAIAFIGIVVMYGVNQGRKQSDAIQGAIRLHPVKTYSDAIRFAERMDDDGAVTSSMALEAFHWSLCAGAFNSDEIDIVAMQAIRESFSTGQSLKARVIAIAGTIDAHDVEASIRECPDWP